MEFSGDLQAEGHTDQRSRVSLEVLGLGDWAQVPDLERQSQAVTTPKGHEERGTS